MKAIESYRDHFLALDYQGQPVGILNRRHGATDKDLELFIKAHVPNAVDLQNFAEYLDQELNSTEAKRRLADLTKKRRVVNEATDGVRFEVEMFEHDARLRLLNEIVDRFVGIARYAVKPRGPQPEPAAGQRGRERAQAAHAALQAALQVDPKLAKLLEKRAALDGEIDTRRAELHLEQSRREAVIVRQAEQRARDVEEAERPKTLADKFRDYMSTFEKEQRQRERVKA